MEVIDNFKGEYFFLSNFYQSPVVFNGYTFQSAEAAFQAQKCPQREGSFVHLTPSQAKALGRRVPLRSDWEQIKDWVMEDVVDHKFRQNPALAVKLIDTNPAILIEGNTWNDKYWGQVNGEGANKLGKILMNLRAKLIHESTLD